MDAGGRTDGRTQLNLSSNLATHPSPLSDSDEADSDPAKRERESKLALREERERKPDWTWWESKEIST